MSYSSDRDVGYVDPNPPFDLFRGLRQATSLELTRRDELPKRSDVSLLTQPLQTGLTRSRFGALDGLSRKKWNPFATPLLPGEFEYPLNDLPWLLNRPITVQQFLDSPVTPQPGNILYTLPPRRPIAVRQSITFPAFSRHPLPPPIVTRQPASLSSSSRPIPVPQSRRSTSREDAYVTAADLAPKKVRFSDEVPSSMASSDNDGGSVYCDPNPPFGIGTSRTDEKVDSEKSEAKTERAAAIDPRTGEPYKYGTPNHHGHAPRISSYTHFRMVDGMLMNPPPGGRRVSSDDTSKDKDKKKVRHFNLAWPGLPSGHRIKMNNPNNDDDAETVAGSIFDYPEKPAMFNPWTSTRMAGLKSPTTTGQVARAKKEAEAAKAKAEAEAREKAEVAAKEVEEARKTMQPTAEDASESSLTTEALSRHNNGSVDNISSWKVEPRSEHKKRKAGSDTSLASSTCSRASHAELKKKTLALEAIYEKAEQERREERKAFEEELKAREEDRKEREKQYEEERRKQAEEHAELLGKLLSKIDDLTASKNGNSTPASSEDGEEAKKTTEKLLQKIEDLEKKVDELKQEHSKASTDNDSAKDSKNSKPEASGKNGESSTKKADKDGGKTIDLFGNNSTTDTWHGNGNGKGKKNKKGNSFEPFNWANSNDKEEQKEETWEEPKGKKGSKKDSKKESKKNASFALDDKKDEKKGEPKDDKKDSKTAEKKGGFWGTVAGVGTGWSWNTTDEKAGCSSRHEGEGNTNNDIPPSNEDAAKEGGEQNNSGWDDNGKDGNGKSDWDDTSKWDQ